jgi:hypothetical protein
MTNTGKTEIRALNITELDEVSGGVVSTSALTAALAAVATTAKLALRIISEREERQSQVIQKITS